MRSPEMFGGRPPEEMGKKPESAEKKPDTEGEVTELVPYGELLTNVGEQMTKVVQVLEEERKLSDDIRKMGGKVTRETAERVMDLERQKNGLLEVYTETLEPVRKEAFEAFLDRQELAVEKPANLDALMTDPEVIEVTDDMYIEVQTSDEMAKLERDLVAEADKAREEMVGLVEAMRAAENEPKPAMPDLGDPEIRRAYRGLMEARYTELGGDVAAIERLIGQGLLPANSAETAKQEMRQVDAVILRMMSEDIEEASAREKAEEMEGLKKAHVGILNAKFGELRNYVRVIDSKLKEVRFNLGFARKMDAKEGRKAA